MNMFFIPTAMWSIFRRSFKTNLDILGVSDAEEVMCAAKQRYKERIDMIPTGNRTIQSDCQTSFGYMYCFVQKI